MYSNLLKMLKLAIHTDLLTLDELQDLRGMVTDAIARKVVRAQPEGPVNRQTFIETIIQYGLTAGLPLTPEHLLTVAEYLYDTEVLGKSPEDILSDALRRNRPET